MKILFDNGTPKPIARSLPGHEIIALVTPGNQQWPMVKLHLDKIAVAVNAATPGGFAEVDIPFK